MEQVFRVKKFVVASHECIRVLNTNRDSCATSRLIGKMAIASRWVKMAVLMYAVIFLLIVLPVDPHSIGPDLCTWFEDPRLFPSRCSDAYSVVPGRLLCADRVTWLSNLVFRLVRRKGGRSYCRRRNFAVLVMILLLSGDLELNPGPPGGGRRGSLASSLADVAADSSHSCLGDVCRSGCMLLDT